MLTKHTKTKGQIPLTTQEKTAAATASTNTPNNSVANAMAAQLKPLLGNTQKTVTIDSEKAKGHLGLTKSKDSSITSNSNTEVTKKTLDQTSIAYDIVIEASKQISPLEFSAVRTAHRQDRLYHIEGAISPSGLDLRCNMYFTYVIFVENLDEINTQVINITVESGELPPSTSFINIVDVNGDVKYTLGGVVVR